MNSALVENIAYYIISVDALATKYLILSGWNFSNTTFVFVYCKNAKYLFIYNRLKQVGFKCALVSFESFPIATTYPCVVNVSKA